MRHDNDRMTGMQDQLMVTCAVVLAVLVKTKNKKLESQGIREKMPPSQQAEKPESHKAEEPECQEVRTLIKKLRSQKAKKPGSQVIGKSQAPKTKSSTSSIPTPKCDFPALWDC